jgi:hypothetical protein
LGIWGPEGGENNGTLTCSCHAIAENIAELALNNNHSK